MSPVMARLPLMICETRFAGTLIWRAKSVGDAEFFQFVGEDFAGMDRGAGMLACSVNDDGLRRKLSLRLQAFSDPEAAADVWLWIAAAPSGGSQ